MKSLRHLLLPVLAAIVLGAGFAAATGATAAEAPKPKLRHVVGFKFKEEASRDQIAAVEKAFAALKGKIPQIRAYEWGTNNSPEGLNKGCTHGFILTFDSEADRDAYLIHPDHKAFGALLRPILADVFVIDFWAKE